MDEEQKGLLADLVSKLVREDFESILSTQSNGRLSVGQIKMALDDYPGKPSLPPKDFTEKAEYYPRTGKESEEGSAEVNLWFDGEESDLTLLVDFNKNSGDWIVVIDDIHVL